MNISKHQSNLPLLDNIVYYSKLLTFNSVLKDENEAIKNETLESIRNSDLYIACKDDLVDFSTFQKFTIDQLIKVGLDDQKYVDNKYLIPLDKRDSLVRIAKNDFINNYIETNNYYSMLNGKPNVGDPGIYVDYVDGIEPNYIHEMSYDELQTLENSGQLDIIKSQNPDKKYLNFLGVKRIDPYFARKTDKFGLLYFPNINISEVTSRFVDIFERNRVYTLKCVYNEAFKMSSDYYDNFIMIFIKIQTIVDMIANIPDYIIKKDLFDIISIKHMFESNGIEFFEEIPLKYQIAMLKNMNTLIKFKSTTKNMIDICSIFGFNNIEIFKYYLLKERNRDESGNYLFETKVIENDNGEQLEIDDNEKNYTLKFIKVPIENELDNYIRDETNHISYNELTEKDPYWTGGRDADEVKKEILEYEFNYLRSKYLSIDTIYEMDKLTFEMSYFFNMIFDNDKLEQNLMLNVRTINLEKRFKLNNVIFYLYTLIYEQNGFKDSILDTSTKIMYIRGFNFEADLNELSNYIQSKGFTMRELGIDFEIPNKSYLTINQLIEVFIKNKKCHDHIVSQLLNADNKRIYDIYKHIYDALMITRINNKIFKLSNGNIAKTYTEYFMEKDPHIYEHLMSIRNLEGKEKESKITETITSIVYALEDYVDTEEFTFLFTNLPSVSSDIVRGYMFKVINFFKSYKVELSNINNIYKFNDKFGNKINILDDIGITKIMSKNELMKLKEKTYFETIMTLNSKISLKEYILFSYLFSLTDEININDFITLKSMILREDYNHFQFKTKMNINSSFKTEDHINIEDDIFIQNI